MPNAEPIPTREPIAAYTLIGGAAVGVVAMALHPTGHEIHAAPDAAAALLRNEIVHATAIVVVLLQTFGSIAIVRRVRGTSVGLAQLALVAQCTAATAATIAAICSGFVMPAHLRSAVANDASQVAGDVLWQCNQAFARLFMISGSAAIAAWSVAGWRRLPRTTCGIGVAVGITTAALVIAGHLRPSVHGMGAVVLGHAIWWLLAGVALLGRVPACSGTP
ncbi:MAG TPA: hypothetical protein VFZ65_08890 [Planctomycetota bacterium]|nr:hypothetical protein [Planctomycetota bacterium]